MSNIQSMALAHAIEAMMCQAASEQKELTLRFSVSLAAMSGQRDDAWQDIDPVFRKDIASNPYK